MKTLNLDFFANDAISEKEMNYLKGGLTPNDRGDLLVPPTK